MDEVKELLQKLLQRRSELNSIEIEDDFQSLVVKARIMELYTVIAMVEEMAGNETISYICTDCDGTGTVMESQYATDCYKCGGSGRLEK